MDEGPQISYQLLHGIGRGGWLLWLLLNTDTGRMTFAQKYYANKALSHKTNKILTTNLPHTFEDSRGRKGDTSACTHK